MEKPKSFCKRHREALLYIIFGVLTTLVNILSFILFSLLFGEEHYLISNLIAWLISVLFAFFTNKLIVFSSASMKAKTLLSEGGKFAFSRILTLGIEELGLWLLLDVAMLGELSLKFIVEISGEFSVKTLLTLAVVILNYFLSKFLIFKKNTEEKQEKNL